MASDQEAFSSSSSNSNSTRTTCKYDIFLSFRGEDTRKGFTDHLYHALRKSGFKVFRDDEELERGEVISKKLLQAIEDSYFAIIVLSKNYASSSWCLDELKHVLYSRDNLCQQVFPIFYDVDPSDVRHQRGSFAEAFARYQILQRDNQVMESWRESLKEVSNLSGWDCKDRQEGELINTVVEELWSKLRERLRPDSEELIGIDNKVKQLEPLLKIVLKDVRFVGICGLPGVGKTTIARAVFEKYRSRFEISCFLHNVRAISERDGEVHLQSKLVSHLKIRNLEVENTYEGKKIIQNSFCNKKVLLILDDVSHTSHLENLANSPNWFGTGSRVIVTTRNSDLLRRVHEVYKHEVEIMDTRESLELFSQKAFERGKPQKDLLKLSKAVCDYANGLPLALSVLGSFFCGRSSVLEWEDALNMLKKNSHKDILRTLKLSFDVLTDTEQAIFLDIACFFNGRSKKDTTDILESCGFNAKIGIATLQEKSMLKEYGDCLVMHDLLEQMGRTIVVDKSPNFVGNRSRLWSKEDIDEVMENNLGTKDIQGMVSSISCEACWDPNAFSTLHSLRLLIISSDFNLPEGLKCLSYALKVLHWTKYPLNTLPSGTQLHKLVDLRMRHSKIKKLWSKSLCSKNLKVLDLSYSKNLIETPNFYELPNLERLKLKGCEGLAGLHASIGQHKNLQVMNLKGCKNFRARCLKNLEMTALKEFILFNCIQVTFLPEFGESMKNLETLDAGETNLVKLPDSLGLLSGLKKLRLRGCKNLVCLPQSILKLKSLVLLDVAGCSKFGRLPENLNELEALEQIDASETDITEIPSSIGDLKKVNTLSFRGCKRSTTNSWSLILPLKYMFFGHSTHNSLTFPTSMFNLKSLTNLNLSSCSIDDGSIPSSFGDLSSLTWLDLSGNMFENLPTGCISKLLKLSRLYLKSCPELQSLPQLGPCLITVDARECGSLETMGDEQLSLLFASIGQTSRWITGIECMDLETRSLTIPGSEIPSWFENQNDRCLNEKGKALMMIDMPPCGEEILGIGLCFVVGDIFQSVVKYILLSVELMFDFAAFPTDPDSPPYWTLGRLWSSNEALKSSHLWIVFWKQGQEIGNFLHAELSEYSHIPLTFRVYNRAGRKIHIDIAKAPIAPLKCGWRVIRRADDFENCDYSMRHSLLPPSEQHVDQAVRVPMTLKWESRSTSVRCGGMRENYEIGEIKNREKERNKRLKSRSRQREYDSGTLLERFHTSILQGSNSLCLKQHTYI